MNKCIETKLTLAGETKRYQCELVALHDGFGILRYIIDQNYDVAGLRLSPGDETIALYWTDRPYTLYVWQRRQQQDRSYYFNIADSVSLRPEEFIWRDLAVDILVDPKGNVLVLDEHELPHDLSPELLGYIIQAKEHLLGRVQDIIEEADRLIGTAG